MPAIVFNRREAETKAFEQIGGDFTVETDGYISVSLRLVATKSGLTNNAVDSIMPKPGFALPNNLYNLPGLPVNAGVYAKSVTTFIENGLQYADIVASSCVLQPQFVLTTSYGTLAYNGSHPRKVGTGNNATTTLEAYSFALKVPIARIAAAYLSKDQFPGGVNVTPRGGIVRRQTAPGMNVAVPGVGARVLDSKVLNINDPRRVLAAAAKTMMVVETLSEESDGSITRATAQYTLQVA